VPVNKDSNLIFEGLNESQLEAVNTLKGPLLILAGAGSGKTRTLTHRIANLIHNGVEPWQIVAVTFTNKAANEMKERINSLLKLTNVNSEQLPVMGTFHSICVRILRRDIEKIGRDKNFVIYDTSDQETLMKGILKDMNIDSKELKPKAALGQVGKFKSEAMTMKEVAEHSTSDWMARMVKIYSLYQKKLRENNALDFDDLILECIRLFKEDPDVLDRYQNTWKYLNVDEYQDTNHAQYMFISMLAGKYRNLCVIGDPDQSIYAFRGADIRNILEFNEEYADAVSIKLERNYRSTQQILDSSDAVIAHNPGRPQKKMWTHRADGNLIDIQEVRDEKDEAEETVKNVLGKLANGTSLNEQVVLYRTNAQSRHFEEACMRNAMPYRIVGGVKFYARREVKDLLAYLYAMHNPQDAISLLRVINVPARKIGKTTIEKINAFCQEHEMSFWSALKNINSVEHINEATKNRISEFATLIEKYRERKSHISVSQLSTELLEEIKMEKWLRDDTTEGETRWENIGELINVMHKYDQLEPAQSFVNFLEEVALVSEVDKMNDTRDDALTLMTLHLCKGLEFEHVVVAGCEEGIFPHSNCMFDKEQLEEERRLMYVGMTRAKDHLTIMHANSRTVWGDMQANAASRFIDDIPEKLVERKGDVMSRFGLSSSVRPSRTSRGLSDLDFNQDINTEEDFNQDPSYDFDTGARIHHPVFGDGTIMSLSGDIAEIRFDSGNVKKIALNVVKVEVI
jgi:DNA helicase II / ATP-dependent DNA helicase PcrA